jgi:adenylate cyclase
MSKAPAETGGQWRFGLFMLSVLCLVCSPFFINRIARDAPDVENGAVDFSRWGALTRPVQLDGNWAFRWEAPVLQGSAPATMRVPGVWEGAKGTGDTVLPGRGLARYAVTITGLQPGQYRLFFPSIYAANRVFLDGREVAARGLIGTDAAHTRYQWRANDIALVSDGSPLRIEVEIATFLHRDNGMESPPLIGLPQPVGDWIGMRWAQELLFHVSLVLMGLFSLVAFAFRRSDKASLGFAVCCFGLLPYSAVIGFDNVLLMIFPDLPLMPLLAILYTSTVGALLCFLIYTNALFPAERMPRFYRVAFAAVVALLVAQCISFFSGNTWAASKVNSFLLYAVIIVFSYIMTMLGRAVAHRRSGAVAFLLGIAVLFVSILMLAIVAFGILPSNKVPGLDFVDYGMLVLLFSHMVVLAERWSLATSTAERMNDDLRQLLDVNLAITSEMQLEALLTKIVSVTTKILNADRSSLLMFDPKKDELQSIVAEGVTGQNIRFPASTGIAGHALRTGETVNVPDAYADPRFMREMDTRTGYRTKTILSMPVTTRDGKRIGIMQALNRVSPGPFDAEDEARMGAFAAQAAVAIENATLFKEVVASRNYNEGILRSMSNGVITLDRDGRVTKLNDAACAIMGVTAEAAVDADWRTVVARDNPAILGEIESVAANGLAKTLLDTDILTLDGKTISANVSIVPLMGETRQEGLLVLIDDISQGKRLEGAMRRFMTQKVVDQVLSQSDDLLFGSTCEASVLFADIRNFTTMSEALAPRATVDMLNEIFTDLFEAVAESDGVLDKFIGDAVMAVYGAPLSSGRDPQNAVASAIRMQEMMTQINLRRASRGMPPLRLGVGIASGEVIAGTIGSPKRMDYTVIGDSVNLAARLQDITKFYQADIVVCEVTAAANADVPMRELDLIRVRGRSRPARIFEVLTSAAAPEWHADYRRGRAHLAARQWREAVAAFDAALAAAPTDWASTIMRTRAQSAMESPLPEDWDGVWDSHQSGAA